MVGTDACAASKALFGGYIMPIEAVQRAWLWLESVEDQVPADVSRVV